MLNFLRKHQKIFFIFITAAIVISFSFFGTYSSMASQERAPDKELFKGVSGKPVMQQELAVLTRLISSSLFDEADREAGKIPNLLNDGVVEKDFIASGLGLMLAKRYFDELKPDLDVRVKKIHHFRPYAHPKAKQISVEGVWEQFAPQMLQHFHLLKARSDQATTETLAIMSQLYLEQAMLPPEMIKQVLAMQHKQQGIEMDPQFARADLSLFGFKSMEDWFGPHFVSLIAQFIANAAQLAEEKGYQVTKEEIRSDLYQNIYQGYQRFAQNATLPAQEAEQYYQTKMHGLGLDETMLLSAWEKVMLFRRLFDDASGSVFVDRLAYQQFNAFAKESVRVSLYQLPSALQFGSFREMLKFQVYVEGVAADAAKLRTDLQLPKQLASVEQIEKRAPELVERRYELEWNAMSKEELARAISIKETWDWEAENAHWEMLRKNFPEVNGIKAEAKAQRLSALDTLDKKARVKIDQFARVKMVEEHPEKIKQALEQAPLKTEAVGVRLRGGELPFAKGKERAELVALLEKAALKGELPNSANQRLSFYSPNGENYYAIQVIQREPAKKILSLVEAQRDGTLDKMLDKRLEEAYPEVRKKDSALFQQSNGEYKPFKEVKDQVGKFAFADLLKTIEDHYRSQFGNLPEKVELTFYGNARLLPYMNQARSHLEKNPEDSAWVKATNEQSTLVNQWLLEKKEERVERCKEVLFSKDEMFSLPAQQWSSVVIGDQGHLAFYFIHGREEHQAPPLEAVEQGHQILSYDAKRDMMLQILQKIHEKKAIDLSLLVAVEERQ